MIVRFLILRFSSIGDIVLTTPVIRCLKQQFNGEVEIYYATKQQFATLVEPNPYLSGVFTLKDKDTTGLIQELKTLQFDYIIDLHNNIRTARIKKALSIPALSFNKLNWQKWLLVNLKINRLPKVHIVDRYLETVRFFDVTNDHQGLDYFIPENQHINPPTLFAEHQVNYAPYIAFVVGGSFATKVLPVEKAVTTIQKINQPVVLVGGPNDRQSAEEIRIRAGKHKVLNACGALSLHQSASVIQQAEAVISNDTGMMHIAAAFHKKIIALWGNTIPEFGMEPYVPKNPRLATNVQVNGLRCRPCSKLGYNKCPKKHFYCMNLIDEQEIINAL